MDGNAASVSSMIKAGLDPNSSTSDHIPLLVWAASSLTNKAASVMEVLLKAGADPNVADSEGETPLIQSVRRGCQACVALLLSYHANAKPQDKHGDTALLLAARMPLAPNQDEWGLPSNVDADTFASIGKQLIDAGANPNQRSADQLSTLEWAVATGKRQLVKVLLQRGATAAGSRSSHTTSLVIASARGDTQIIQDLIRAGANPNEPDSRGVTPLKETIFMGNVQTASLLTSLGAQADCPMIAAEPRSFEDILKGIFCSDRFEVAFRGKLGVEHEEFIVAGIPRVCPHPPAKLHGKRLFAQLAVIRNVKDTWVREYSEDYYGKNTQFLITQLLPNAPSLLRLLPQPEHTKTKFSNGVSYRYIMLCNDTGDTWGIAWNPAKGRFQSSEESGEWIPELSEAK